MNTIKNIKNKTFFIGILSAIFLLGIAFPQTTLADFAIPCMAENPNKATRAVKVVLTAYSSTEDQTDSTPFITASNKYVEDGIIANNMLPFGTKIKIPELYGDKVFVVEDRMHKRKGNYRVDIWMPTRTLALNFGVKTATIEILEN